MNSTPSRADIRARALFAASSVVLAMTGGCGKDGGVFSVIDPSVDTDRGAVLADTDATADTDHADTDTTTVDTDVAADTDNAKPDCTATPNQGPCCDNLRAWCDLKHPHSTQAQNDCLYGPNFSGSTGCSPWGPPAPPRARLA